MGLNLRGVKESILILTPIFVVFLVTHMIVIGSGIFSHGNELPTLVADTWTETREGIGSIGLLAMGGNFPEGLLPGGRDLYRH
jgi:amino acid transporter